MSMLWFYLADPLVRFFLPALLLLFFYSLNSRRLIWLTIPVTLLAYALCFWRLMGDGMVLLGFGLYAAALSAVTAVAALIKSKAKKPPSRRIVVILAAVICAGALGFAVPLVATYAADLRRADIDDRPVFQALTQIQPEDIEEIVVFDDRDIVARVISGEGVAYADFNGEKTFFADLEYAGTSGSRPERELGIAVDVTLHSDELIRFCQ
ncbi:MAG: hypothetical protein LBB75_09540 [Oscillospiraceae bacterium]|jgi:hypothetical protein|nr:hypothetical protein [Oscillospiraceae bacterium]